MSLNGFGVFTVQVALATDADRDNSLDGINTVHLDTGVLGWVQSGAAASSLFWLDKTDNTTAPDGTTVVAPLTGPGRWKLLITGAGAASVKVGYDQNEKSQALSDGDGLIPSDGATPPNPLQVVLTGLKPGNFIEIDWNLAAQTNDGVDQYIAVVALVSFDATPTDPVVDGTGWFLVNSSFDSRQLRGTQLNPWPDLLRSLSAFELPATNAPYGSTPVDRVTVVLGYAVESASVFVYGNDEGGFPAAPTLKVTELQASSVEQQPPIFLVPLAPP